MLKFYYNNKGLGRSVNNLYFFNSGVAPILNDDTKMPKAIHGFGQANIILLTQILPIAS